MVFQELIDTLFQCFVYGISSGTRSIPIAQVDSFKFRRLDDFLIMTGNSTGVFRFVFDDEVWQFLRIELGDNDRFHAKRQWCMHPDSQTVCDERRHNDQNGLSPFCFGNAVTVFQSNIVHVFIGQDSTFGNTGRSAGINNGGGSVRLVIDIRDCFPVSRGDELFPGHGGSAFYRFVL